MTNQNSQQFSIGSLLWMTTAIALLIIHARGLGQASMQLLTASMAFWIVAAVLFSLLSKRPTDVWYWSALIATEGFLAVSAVRAFEASQAMGWGLVGAMCGAFCGARLTSSQIVGSVASAMLGGLSMVGLIVYYRQPFGLEVGLDIVGALAVGFALWFFVEFLRWFLAQDQPGRKRASHFVLAAWLTICVLAGNWLVRYCGY